MDPERTGPAAAPTGDRRVDQAIERLASLDGTALDDRPEALAAVHDRLREILGELGDAAGPGHRGDQGTLGPARR